MKRRSTCPICKGKAVKSFSENSELVKDAKTGDICRRGHEFNVVLNSGLKTSSKVYRKGKPL